MSTDDWRHQAACRGLDGELFFPRGDTGPWLIQIAEAKAVCRRCPVVDSCLQWAISNGVDAGVFGGMDEKERHNLKRRLSRRGTTPRTPAKCGTRPGYKRHLREHTAVCEPCRSANADYVVQHQHTKETV